MPRQKFDPSLIPLSPDLQFEANLWTAGVLHVAGVDEAGRGALAGPVAAAAVILPPLLDFQPELQAALCGVRDSKELTPEQREDCAGRIRAVALAWAVGFANSQEIDHLGIVPATRLAVARALFPLSPQPDHLLVDFLALPEIPVPQTSLVKGDARSLSIAAASILAKTSRDALMRTLSGMYPVYEFAQHKGYGTLHHRKMIAIHGPSPIHRRTFMPVKNAPAPDDL